ncbi:MAG TPA: glycosyltransferase family 2 protein [Nocardioidaceae bacterium]|nr:glycosyltransferase family 2 protein [Nocardioidaceae bacterium]
MTEAGPDPVSPGDGPAPGTPDVTVIIPVYNTMPYLTDCLQSMVDQTIGADRMEVVAVDDGSTDGSGEELERFGTEHPGLFTVIHQENSGGPAGPCNRGLEVARGRYVFFIGADDYLADYALERMVDRADAWQSDVVMGRIVGVGGRRGQTRFTSDEADVPFPHSQLPFALGNSKMFRRSLLEEHGIRYPLDLRVGSDQPFTVAAMLHARRISVLAGDPYYYGLRREDSSNITFSSGWRTRLEDIGTVMGHIAELVPPGPDRDQILHRHFTWELANRLRADFLDLAEGDQRALTALVRGLADEYLTDGVAAKLPVGPRLRLRLAQAGRLEELRVVVAAERDRLPAPVAVRDGRVFLALPGYGDHPDEWFESRTENVLGRLTGGVRVTGLAWRGPVLEVEATGRSVHPDSAGNVAVEVRALPGTGNVAGAAQRASQDRTAGKPALRAPVVLEPDATVPDGSTLRVELDLSQLPPPTPRERRRWSARLVLDAGDRSFDLPLVADEAVPRDTVTQVRTAAGWFRLLARVGPQRRLVLVRRPVAAEVAPRRERLRAVLRRFPGRSGARGESPRDV